MFRFHIAAALVLMIGSAFAGERPPNVLLIFVDDLGYGELGCQGNPEIPTPHIDSIAKEGVRFTAGYVSAPYCSPSRAGLLTGRYQNRFGYEFNPVGEVNLNPRAGLPASELTIAEALQSAGYRTGLVGKWHLGGSEEYHPLKHGFDEFFGFLHEGHFYVPSDVEVPSHLREKEPPYDRANPMMRGTEEVEESDYLTDAFTREAVDFIDRHKDGPFFLYLAYNAVHSPMQAAPEYYARFENIEDRQRRVFAGMLAALDDGVGKVLAALRERELDEDTLIFFISDNGGPTAELTSSNAPLRGGKGRLWEGGVRVPFLVRWTGTFPAGGVYRYPVISLDVFPTALAAAGGTPPKDLAIDGVNLVPYMTGELEGRPHETLYWRYGANFALRHGDWKIVRQTERNTEPAAIELFDLSEDISEQNDLSKMRPVSLGKLYAEYRRIDTQMIEPRWRQ